MKLPVIRLRTILFVLSLIVLILPIGTLAALRIYQTELLRQTENELKAQAALIAPAYRASWAASGGNIERTIQQGSKAPEPLEPLTMQLDLAQEQIHEPAVEAVVSPLRRDTVASNAGAQLISLIQEGARRTLAGVRIVDANGIVIASTGGELDLYIGHREEVKQALRGNEISLIRHRYSDSPAPEYGSLSRRSPIRVFVAMPVLLQGQVLGAVILSRTPDSVLDALWRNRHNFTVASLVLFAIVLMMVMIASTFVNQPIQELIIQAEAVTSGKISIAAPIAAPRLVEVDRLSRAIVRMAKALHDRTIYIKDFVNHVSHEFKTPLTTITGTVELLRDHISFANQPEADRLLTMIGEDTDRLARMVRKMLELARADMIFSQTSGSCDVLKIVKSSIARLSNPDIQIHLTVPSQSYSYSAKIAAEALDTILVNLINNAILHGKPPIEVMVYSSVQDVFIEVVDHGPGISDENRKKIFDPFFTTKREQGGTGLGLAIVQSLVISYQGEISITTGPSGTTFKVRLPALSVQS